MDKKKRDLKNEYRQNPPKMGVYQVRNEQNGRIFIGSALNVGGAINSSRVQLNAGSHPNRKLQTEWREFGADAFKFEILDELSPGQGSFAEQRAEVAVLEEFWLEKMQPYGEVGYNEKRKGTEERLRMITENRLSKESGSDA